jgi:hypothetical protein
LVILNDDNDNDVGGMLGRLGVQEAPRMLLTWMNLNKSWQDWKLPQLTALDEGLLQLGEPGKTATTFTGEADSTRGQCGTTAAAHKDDEPVQFIKTEEGETPPDNFAVPTSEVEGARLKLQWVEY